MVHAFVQSATTPFEADLELNPFQLEAGAQLSTLRMRLWMLGPQVDHDALAAGAQLPEFPTVVVVHPLTASAAVAGASGFWDGVVGNGRALKPWKHRLLSFNQLGSCFGSSGPADLDFPTLDQDSAFAPEPAPARGDLQHDARVLPATVTPWDQARAVWAAIDKLGVRELELVVGGSTGGMVAQCIAALAAARVRRVVSIAAPHASTAWMIAQNHLAREALLRDPAFPYATTGLSLARQIARLSYRSPANLEARQGRRMTGPAHVQRPAWSTRTAYRVETYLRHHGDTFVFHPLSYFCLTRAMDHHDLLRSKQPLNLNGVQCTNVRVSSDGLVTNDASMQLSEVWRGAGARVQDCTLECEHGHDGFLAAQSALGTLITRALHK